MASFNEGHEGERVAVTGRAVLTPLADAPDVLHAALLEGRSAVAPAPDLGDVGVAEIRDFDFTKYAAVRGMRMYNRTTRMAICAAKLALADAAITPGTTYAGDDLGILMASTYGHLDVLCEYDRSLVTNGMQRTNASLMPFSIPSAAGAMVALAFGLKAFSLTLANGNASALDALGLGARWLSEGRAKGCVVVASFASFPDLVLAAARAGLLAPARQLRVFDDRSSGTAIGEAAVAFVLERVRDAETRGKAVHGHVCGYGTCFAGAGQSGLGEAVRRAAADALRGARLRPADVALVSAGGSGEPELDRAETDGLDGLFCELPAAVPITAHKGALGETFDVSGALQTLVALSSLKSRTAPPVASLADATTRTSHLAYLRKPGALRGGVGLVTSTSRAGSSSAVVVVSEDLPGV
jgi:3-oxoacyl-(acyl-carrier-protein) synthase